MNPLRRLSPPWHIARARLSPGAPSGAASVRLPFNESPVVATFLHTAFFFGILTAEGLCDGLLNIHLQLAAPRKLPESLSILPLRFLPTIPPDHQGLLESHDWTPEQMAALGRAGLPGAIASALAEGRFLYVNLNYYYLPGTAFYRRHHFRQSALVTALDAGRGEFTVACYLAKGKFGLTRIRCRLLAEAFFSPLGRGNSTDAARADRLHSMRRVPDPGEAGRLDLDVLRWQMADYLDGTNEAPRRMRNPVIREWCARHDRSTCADTLYGSAVYEGFVGMIEGLRGRALKRFDFRITRLIWEHKKLMTLRLRRLEETGAVSLPGLLARWEAVEQAAWALHFTLFRAEAKKEPMDLPAAAQSLREIAAREREILGEVRAALSRP